MRIGKRGRLPLYNETLMAALALDFLVCTVYAASTGLWRTSTSAEGAPIV
jgi:hypothetical protein